MKFFIILSFLFFFKSQSYAVRIFCEYKYMVWPIIGNSYTCQVRNFNLTQQNDSIVKVSGDHIHQRLNYNHVTALEIRGQTCHFLPQRIKNFFPNLELLRVVNSQLKIISQSDLKPLTKLRVVQMNGNHLTNLNNDLFEANLNLVRVDFRSQKLKLVGYNIFDKLERLALADFQFSGCVNYFAENGRTGIEHLKKEIRINCQPIEDFANEIKALREKIEILENSNQNAKLQNLNLATDEAFMKLNAKLLKLEDDNQQCLANSEVLIKNFHAIIDKVDIVQQALKMKSGDSCVLEDVKIQKCLIENEKLLRMKRESSSIDVECEKVEWMRNDGKLESCNLRNLKIIDEEFEVKNLVTGHRDKIIDSNFITELKAFNQQVPFLPTNLPTKFPNLKSLSFTDCSLSFVNTKLLENLINLQTLSFSNNLIKEISPTGFKNLDILTNLDLSYNKLEKINEETFKSLIDLSILKLNNNLLTELSENSFANLKKLKFLFLQNNKLSMISPKLLEPLKRLELADFKENVCVDLEVSRESLIPIKNMKFYFDENCMGEM